jgi:hypothetical protein
VGGGPDNKITITYLRYIARYLPGYTSNGESEQLFGDDWAKLSLLEERPLVNFVQNPAVEVQLPRGGDISGFFEVTGQVAGGALPVFLTRDPSPRCKPNSARARASRSSLMGGVAAARAGGRLSTAKPAATLTASVTRTTRDHPGSWPGEPGMGVYLYIEEEMMPEGWDRNCGRVRS